jgi:hypothetical protein
MFHSQSRSAASSTSMSAFKSLHAPHTPGCCADRSIHRHRRTLGGNRGGAVTGMRGNLVVCDGVKIQVYLGSWNVNDTCSRIAVFDAKKRQPSHITSLTK